MTIIEDVKETPDAKTAGGGALDDDEVWGDVEDVSILEFPIYFADPIILTKFIMKSIN